MKKIFSWFKKKRFERLVAKRKLLPQEDKDYVIRQLLMHYGKDIMCYFYALNLEDGICSMMVNDTNKDEFVFLFKRITKENEQAVSDFIASFKVIIHPKQ